LYPLAGYKILNSERSIVLCDRYYTAPSLILPFQVDRITTSQLLTLMLFTRLRGSGRVAFVRHVPLQHLLAIVSVEAVDNWREDRRGEGERSEGGVEELKSHLLGSPFYTERRRGSHWRWRTRRRCDKNFCSSRELARRASL
jgi:hypothetical protein